MSSPWEPMLAQASSGQLNNPLIAAILSRSIPQPNEARSGLLAGRNQPDSMKSPVISGGGSGGQKLVAGGDVILPSSFLSSHGLVLPGTDPQMPFGNVDPFGEIKFT